MRARLFSVFCGLFLAALVACADVPDVGIEVQQSPLSWQSTLSVGSGTTKWWTTTANANQAIYVAFTPSQGDADLRAYRLGSNGQWVYVGSSLESYMRVDRMKLQYSAATTFKIEVYGKTTATGRLSFSWEMPGNRLDLDVPYLSQNTLGQISPAACSSASAAMILATHAFVRVDDMIPVAQNIFAATANMQVGLLGRAKLAANLEDVWGVSQVDLVESGWPTLYAKIQSEIRAGRPLILGSKSMSAAGHYIVVRGFVGNDWNTAKLIVNDPNGRWKSKNSWATNESGAGLEYDYKTITSAASDGVLVIVP